MKKFEMLPTETGSHDSAIFNANEEELNNVIKYYLKEKDKGVKDEIIINELYSQGWTTAELMEALPKTTAKYKKNNSNHYTRIIILIIVAFFLTVFGNEIWPASILNIVFALLLIYLVIKLFEKSGFKTKVSILDRRIILFYERFSKLFGLKKFPSGENYFLMTKKRNPRKIFLPIQEKYQFKAYGGHGVYKGKKYNIFIAKKYSHSTGEYNTPVYRHFLFYEFEIKYVPFHYALVKQSYYEPQAGRLQNSNIKPGDFKDMDFAAREFNKNWRLRGSDKKLAYQIFGPHMKSILLQIETKDFLGLEISDRSVMMSFRLARSSMNRSIEDFKITYEIAKQVERNYREIKWD